MLLIDAIRERFSLFHPATETHINEAKRHVYDHFSFRLSSALREVSWRVIDANPA